MNLVTEAKRNLTGSQESGFDLEAFVSNPENQKKALFYSCPVGHQVGIFFNWEDCRKSITGCPRARFKKFTNLKDAVEFFEYHRRSELCSAMSTVKEEITPQEEVVLATPGNETGEKTEVSEAKKEGGLASCELVFDQLAKNSQTNSTTTTFSKVPASELANPKKKDLDIDIINIYCDGSVPNNGCGGDRGGIGILFGSEEYSEAVPEGKFGPKMTNNIAELYALLRSFELIDFHSSKNPGKLYTVYSDSEYSINSITVWADKLKPMFRDKVKNFDLIVRVYEKYLKVEHICQLKHVAGHANSVGNIKADLLARKASGENPLKRQTRSSTVNGEDLKELLGFELPPGEYDIDFEGDFQGSVNKRAPQDPSLPFDIEGFLSDPANTERPLYYSVPIGHRPGIFFNWEECRDSVTKCPNARFKKFFDVKDAVNFFKAHSPFWQNKVKEEDVQIIANPMQTGIVKIESTQNENPKTSQPLDNNLASKMFGKQIVEAYCGGCVPQNGSIDAKGGISVLIGRDEFTEAVPGDVFGPKMTNNIAELYALMRAFEIIEKKAKDLNEPFFRLYSESEYAINSITVWSGKLKSQKKRENIKNLALILKVFEKFKKVEEYCQLLHVKGNGSGEKIKRVHLMAKRACEKIERNESMDTTSLGSYTSPLKREREITFTYCHFQMRARIKI